MARVDCGLCKFACPNIARLRHWVFVLTLLAATLSNASIIRDKRTTKYIDNTAIRTEYVDRNNQTILDKFNLTEAQRIRIAAGNNFNIDHTATPREGDPLHSVKVNRINHIRNRLNVVLGRSEQLYHEMAAYPLCNAESNEASWQDEYNVTMQFSNRFLEMKHEHNLDSAILRLYKINPNSTGNEQSTQEATTIDMTDKNAETIANCAEPMLDQQIRVTVSLVQRRNKRAERKKRICNTVMMNVSKTGWVEIDIKRAIYIWERPQTRPAVLIGYLMIEVHDDEERPLKPGLFFQPPNCDQAVLAFPWNYYGSKSSLSTPEVNDVPRFPRIDVKLTGYASFAPKNFNAKAQLPDMAMNFAQHDTNVESNTSNTPDNQLETSTHIDILSHIRNLQEARKQRHENYEHNENSFEQQQYDVQTSQENDDFEQLQRQQQHQQQQQHTRHHRRLRRHHNHHHNHQHQHVQHKAARSTSHEHQHSRTHAHERLLMQHQHTLQHQQQPQLHTESQ